MQILALSYSKAMGRIFFLGVNTGYVRDETPTAQHIKFHADRSGNGLYCTIVGNVLTPRGHGTNSVCARISRAPEWKTLANEIQNSGAIAGIQLSSTWTEYQGIKEFKNKSPENKLDEYLLVAKRINNNNIKDIFSNLRSASELSIEAGFKHIQLHAAHGYLFNLLLDPFFSSNYELALEEFCRWVEYLKANNIESSIRLSTKIGMAQIDSNDTRLAELMDTPCDYVDLSQGLYNIEKRLIYPTLAEILDARWETNIDTAKRHPNRNFIASGKFRSDNARSRILPENINIGICRDLIANPNFLENRSDGCQNKMKCHYFSRNEDSLSCGKWNK